MYIALRVCRNTHTHTHTHTHKKPMLASRVSRLEFVLVPLYTHTSVPNGGDLIRLAARVLKSQ
jgi:hypothetical protein